MVRPARGFRGATTGFSPVSHGAAASPDDAAGVLLVVDYADRWVHSELERLLSEPLLHQQRPTRVLLIGRTVRWFAALRGSLGERRAAVDDLLLPDLAVDRPRMFAAARDRYAAPDLYGVPDASGVRPPGSLEHREFGLTLTLHMAALAAVDAHARGQQAPARPHELSAYLLDRERLAWQRLSEAGVHGQDFRTRPSTMAKTVFTAALTGAVSHRTGTRALRTLEVPGDPQELIADHRFCYPPADRDLVLEPLYPDRLAEDFLGLLLPGHDITGDDPDPWTLDAPAALTEEGRLRSVVAPRTVTMLASAAARWAHVGRKVLYPLLRADPGVAVEAGSPALTTLAELGGTNPYDGRLDAELLSVLEAVEDRLPNGRHADLDIGILALAEVLIPQRLAATTDPGRLRVAARHAGVASRQCRAQAGGARRHRGGRPSEPAGGRRRPRVPPPPGGLAQQPQRPAVRDGP